MRTAPVEPTAHSEPQYNYFGPNGEVGLCGSVGVAGLALQIGAAATAQLTVMDGGPETLRGTSVVMGVSGGQVLVGGASAIIDARTGETIGWTAEAGVGIGLTPLEGYIQVTDGDASESVTRPRREVAQ